jgi:hypothetical protein
LKKPKIKLEEVEKLGIVFFFFINETSILNQNCAFWTQEKKKACTKTTLFWCMRVFFFDWFFVHVCFLSLSFIVLTGLWPLISLFHASHECRKTHYFPCMHVYYMLNPKIHNFNPLKHCKKWCENGNQVYRVS